MNESPFYRGVRISTSQNPRDGVFSTIGWKGNEEMVLLDKHIDRIKRHCNKLLINYPEDIQVKIMQEISLLSALDLPLEGLDSSQPPFLLKIMLSASGEISLDARKNIPHNGSMIATIAEAPRWDEAITGTKHADWREYNKITKHAQDNGFDVALLIFEEAIVDADRGTPIMLDDDGTAWVPDGNQGGVDSITLEYMIQILEEQGIPLIKGRLTAKMILRAQELLVLGTGIGVAKLVEVDGTKIGVGGNTLYNLCNKHLTILQNEQVMHNG